MQETRLLLIRHAETADPSRFHGAESDIGLSDWGRTQAGMLAERLVAMGVQALYCSGMRRARDTAAPAAEGLGFGPIVIPELHERRIGGLSGMSRAEGWAVYGETKARWVAGDLTFSHPGGESFAEIRDRVVPAIGRIVAAEAGKTVALIVHGVVIRVALLTILPGYSPADFDSVAIDFASMNDLTRGPDGWTARALNVVVAPSDARPMA